ncbi:pyroglutamyl-peptidase I [Comamonas testosteroni]|uniref:Pyrrolidone-carboxylate peptidase n=1 Tax=Comamonas testosteroni TaxID=285 RepID=A0A373FEU0_COMTE|nr:pyroglutamyl-peptidase I [Comamonas testosteroni]RGE42656.1 pyroglutamyl-peptidase I [Comamonas testosteroni]
MTAHATSRILLTGFEPFEQNPINPSWEVARALGGEVIAGGTVHAVQLPCVFGDAIKVLDEALAALQPALVISLGYAGGRSEITPERVAINIDDARIPDNAGKQPVDEAVVANAPAAYFSTLPIKAMVRNMRELGVAASVSNTAGTFVCNHVFYALMHRLHRRGAPGMRGGFIHTPVLPGQVAGQPGMDLETQIKGMREAIRTAMTVDEDLRETAGQLY